MSSPEKIVHLFGVFLATVLGRRVRWHWASLLAAAAGRIVSDHVCCPPRVGREAVCVPFAVGFLGQHGLGRLRFMIRPGDVSDGLYIHASPCSIRSWPYSCPPAARGWSLPLPAVTCRLAYASWRLVERPALVLKRLLARPSAPQDPDLPESGESTYGTEPSGNPARAGLGATER